MTKEIINTWVDEDLEFGNIQNIISQLEKLLKQYGEDLYIDKDFDGDVVMCYPRLESDEEYEERLRYEDEERRFKEEAKELDKLVIDKAQEIYILRKRLEELEE